MQRWALATCATAINILFTALTAGILHRYAQHSALNVATHTTAHASSLSLSLHALGNAHHAALATLLFTVNPASVFFTAPYTEATFALLSMAGMLCWVRATPQRPTPWLAAAAVLFAAATATRSNGRQPIEGVAMRWLPLRAHTMPYPAGLLHCGFFAHSVLQAVAAAAQRRCSWTAAMALLAACAACCLVTVAPLVALQAHATMVMCAAAEQGGPAASWCGSVWELLWSPAMYRYGQVVDMLLCSHQRDASHWIPGAFPDAQQHRKPPCI